MSRNVTSGLIQCSNPINDPNASIDEIRDAMFEKHIPLIEEAGKTVREFVCTCISQIEYGIDDRLELDLDIIPWIVRWAAICYSRYAVGRDGRTAYERLRPELQSHCCPMGGKSMVQAAGRRG